MSSPRSCLLHPPAFIEIKPESAAPQPVTPTAEGREGQGHRGGPCPQGGDDRALFFSPEGQIRGLCIGEGDGQGSRGLTTCKSAGGNKGEP